jgi:hypothetical protein
MPVSLDFDIFSPPTSSQPCPKTRRGTGSPAAISIAGQMTAWNRAMSLPTSWYAGQRRRNSASASGVSTPYPTALM